MERLAGVKSHVLRYWEESGWVQAPERGFSGRREYTERELFDVMRFRHLVQARGYTHEQARDALRDESVRYQAERAFADAARARLLDALVAARKLSVRLSRIGREGRATGPEPRT